MKKLFLLIISTILGVAATHAQGWFELGTGSHALKAQSEIYALCSDDSNNVYSAGKFRDTTSGVPGKCYVAKWSVITRNWEMLGTGSNALNANSPIRTICSDRHGNIYAAGDFTDGTSAVTGHVYVAKWNVATGGWTELGTGSGAINSPGAINSICADDSGNVYAAGTIINSGGYFYVAKWNPATAGWSDLGLNANININSICVDDSSNVYAAGNFTDASGHTYVAKYSPLTHVWNELGTGFDSIGVLATYINSIIIDTNHNVYAAVNFVHFSTTYSNVFKWNGTNWIQLGAINGNNEVLTLSKGNNGIVYAGGSFTNTDGLPYIAKYDPTSSLWTEMGGVNALNAHTNFSLDVIYSVYVDRNNYVYAAGSFMDADTLCYVASYGQPYLEKEDIKDKQLNILIYPNPANKILNIILSERRREADYMIYDCFGKVLQSGKLDSSGKTLINVSDLPQGSFIFQAAGYTSRINLIKQ